MTLVTLVPITIFGLLIIGLIGVYKFLERIKIKIFEIKDIMERDFEYL